METFTKIYKISRQNQFPQKLKFMQEKVFNKNSNFQQKLKFCVKFLNFTTN